MITSTQDKSATPDTSETSSDTKKPQLEKPSQTEATMSSQHDLNLIREILLRPAEEVNEERIVELVRMLEEQEETFNKRIQQLEIQVRKLAATIDTNQVNSVADIGNAMVGAGQKILDIQDKLNPTVAVTKP